MSNNEPVVSICCITFKHENYIRECLDGFIMQKTTFPFEVIVHDDASPDKTADIIREYEAKYPDIIKPIYQTENQHSKKIKSLWKHVFPRVRGKYIAICEGDDFWTEPNKLQMQYDFMEANPDYSLCMHGRYILDCYSRFFIEDPQPEDFPEKGIDFAYRVAMGESLFTTQTMFIRKSVFDARFDEIYRDSKDAPMSDLQIAFHLGLAGNVKHIPQSMAVYRRAAGSVTNGKRGYRRDFARRAHAAIDKMLENSGFPEWIKDRRKRKIGLKIYYLFQFLLLPLKVCCLHPKYFKARRRYNEYMKKHANF